MAALHNLNSLRELLKKFLLRTRHIKVKGLPCQNPIGLQTEFGRTQHNTPPPTHTHIYCRANQQCLYAHKMFQFYIRDNLFLFCTVFGSSYIVFFRLKKKNILSIFPFFNLINPFPFQVFRILLPSYLVSSILPSCLA